MVAQCVSPIKASVMRLVELDACGTPATGTSSVVVSDGFVSISPSPQYEDGTEYLTKKANGDLCVNSIDPPALKRVDLEMVWCVLDPDALIIQTGERLLTDSGAVTGTGVAFGEGQITTRYSLEVWQPVSGVNACNAAGQQQYVYWAFPNVGNAQVGDFTFENGVFNFTINSSTAGASTLWGTGPGNGTKWIDQAVQSGDHYLYNVTTTAPPTSACGATTLT